MSEQRTIIVFADQTNFEYTLASTGTEEALKDNSGKYVIAGKGQSYRVYSWLRYLKGKDFFDLPNAIECDNPKCRKIFSVALQAFPWTVTGKEEPEVTLSPRRYLCCSNGCLGELWRLSGFNFDRTKFNEMPFAQKKSETLKNGKKGTGKMKVKKRQTAAQAAKGMLPMEHYFKWAPPVQPSPIEQAEFEGKSKVDTWYIECEMSRASIKEKPPTKTRLYYHPQRDLPEDPVEDYDPLQDLDIDDGNCARVVDDSSDNE